MSLNASEDTATDMAQENNAVQALPNGIDYLHFWLAPRMQRKETVRSIYDRGEHFRILEIAETISYHDGSARFASLLDENKRLYGSGFEPTGSPFFYSVWGSIQTGSFETDYRIFQVLSTLFFGIGLLLLSKINGLSHWMAIILIVFLFAFYRPLQVDFSVANVNRIQVFIYAAFLFLMARKRFMYAGILLGMAIAFKLNLLPVAIVVVGGSIFAKSRFGPVGKLVSGIAVGLALAIAYGALYFGSGVEWVAWYAYVNTFVSNPQPIELGNYSLQQLFGLVVGFAPVLVATGLAVVIGMLCQRSSHQKDSFVFFQTCANAGLFAFLIGSPLVWSHYFVLVIPAIVQLLGQTSLKRNYILLTLCCCGCVLTSGILSIWMTPFQVAATLQCGAVCLLVGVIYQCSSENAAPEAS